MKLRLVALCAAFIALLAPASAGSRAQNITFINESDKCAWFTVYSAGAWSGWHIVSHGENRPRFVKAGERFTFTSELQELKVRAEVMAGPECHGARIADTWDTFKDNRSDLNFTAWLRRNGVNHQYFMKIEHHL